MRVLLYTHGFAPVIGGAEKYVMLLAEGLTKPREAARDIALIVATPTPAGEFEDAQLPFGVVREPSLYRLARLVREADVIHLSGPCLVPLSLGWFFGKPVVVEHHGYPASCPNGLLVYEPEHCVCPSHFLAGHYGKCLKCNADKMGWLKSAWSLFLSFPRRWLCQRISLNAPITRHVMKRLALPQSRVIYYGVPDLVIPRASGGGNRAKHNCLCFAYVGRFVQLKGLPILMEAAWILKKEGYAFQLKFIGDGPIRADLELLAEKYELSGQVEFKGFTTGEALEKEMDSVSAVIMPSIWEETAGLSAIEQMMRGRLVIASEIGGLGEVVGDCGLKCTARDAKSLADCMKKVLDKPEIVDQIGRVARERALDLFLQERMVNEHIDVYQRLTTAKGS